LVYLGNNWSGNGYWHQFAKVESHDVVWCEVLGSDLHMIEETKAHNVKLTGRGPKSQINKTALLPRSG